MTDPTDRIYALLASDDEGRVCRDIPDEACDEQPGNFLRHVVALAATKTGDGLADPKLVLSWLLGALDAPAFYIGLLVPVREAGALVPQLAVAGAIRGLPQRKWVWVAGSLVQGAAVAAMALAAWRLEGSAAGAAIVGLLALFALGRSVCSVSYKDVLGKTVSKSTRGTATGAAATIASLSVLTFGAMLATGVLDPEVGTIAGALGFAGLLWLFAAIVFADLAEAPGATEGGGNALAVAIDQLGLLRRDPQLVRFIITRGLLLATALAPPYILAVVGRTSDRQLGELGPFVIASALAAVSSTYVWGRLADASSRKVLMIAAGVGAFALAIAAALGITEGPGTGASAERLASWIPAGVVFPLVLYILMISYQGVRLGRSTHIVDMADEKVRAAYTALSNAAIGALLVAGGVFGTLAERAGAASVLFAFSVMSAIAVLAAYGLEEVQR